jgi:hypothetical protein
MLGEANLSGAEQPAKKQTTRGEGSLTKVSLTSPTDSLFADLRACVRASVPGSS